MTNIYTEQSRSNQQMTTDNRQPTTDNIILKAENISKQYRLGVIGTGTISHDLNRWWHTVRGKEDPYLKLGETNDRATKGESDFVWALKDINFEVKRGEVLGIIGKNGAGKSTLLKILSRVTGPTTGVIKSRGRIASLLEVGTGFHPELTGKENVFLNGAILGMTKAEINAKLDEIIDFSGVERYIDTPVKRYSSGMRVRLAFAVAAFLEPDILVIDEVLAVGDAEFQKKAIGKMQDISKGEGRTVLFVSHNMASVKSLCTRGIILENGTIKQEGNIDEIVSSYIKGDSKLLNYKNGTLKKPIISQNEIEVYEIGVKAKNKDIEDIITLDDKIVFFIKYKQKTSDKNLHITIRIKDDLGAVIFTNSSSNIKDSNQQKGLFDVSVEFPDNFYNWGVFNIDLNIVKNRRQSIYKEYDILSFVVTNNKKKLGGYMGKELGGIHPNFQWEKKQFKENDIT